MFLCIFELQEPAMVFLLCADFEHPISTTFRGNAKSVGVPELGLGSGVPSHFDIKRRPQQWHGAKASHVQVE